MSLLALLRDLAAVPIEDDMHLDSADHYNLLRDLVPQARALLATLAEPQPPGVAAMEQRAVEVLAVTTKVKGDWAADALARDVQTLLAERLADRAALLGLVDRLALTVAEREAATRAAHESELRALDERDEAQGLLRLRNLLLESAEMDLAEAHAAIWGLVCLMTNCSRWIDQRLRG